MPGTRLELADASCIAGLLQFAQQNCSRNPVRPRCCYALKQIILERIELRRSRLTRLVPSRLFISLDRRRTVLRDKPVCLAISQTTVPRLANTLIPLLAPESASAAKAAIVSQVGQFYVGDRVNFTSALTSFQLL